MKPLLLTLFLSTLGYAQVQKQVVLNWEHSSLEPGITFNAWRAQKLCADTGVADFVKINTAPIPVKTYTDTDPKMGANCYVVTAVFQNEESAQSNKAEAKVPPIPPINLQLTLGIQVIMQTPPQPQTVK